MSNAAIDSNSRQTVTARLLSDGLTVTRIKADHTTGALEVTTATGGAVTPLNYAATDSNGRTSWFAVSENDPTVLVALQCDSSGNLLIKLI